MKIIILEDEFIFAEELKLAIEDMGHDVIGPFSYFSEAMNFIQVENITPDLGIFDITLAGAKSGVDFAKVVNEKYHFPFIFLTSKTNKDVITSIKYTGPSAIMIKPFQIDELFATIELSCYNYSIKNKTITHNQTSPKKNIFIKQKYSFINLSLDDFLYIKSDHVYIDIFTVQGTKYSIRDTLSNFVKELNADFMRVHRSYIVNINLIKKIESDYININNCHIPIGKKYKDDLFLKLNII